MSAARNRLVNALRRSMLQRAALRRQADTARAAFKPSALIDRGKYRLNNTRCLTQNTKKLVNQIKKNLEQTFFAIVPSF